ncbi:hypothetical protein Tco_1054607 [Tanacetum coccineum]|uniref:Reverse transcriptase domain-containing protein n=1 Tax=Tanacetum coccineum TaxID=301880 RepID=A0ABQ5GYS9_9ASTR
MKKKCMDKGSKERSPPHNLRQKPGQYIIYQNHKMIAGIEERRHGPSDAMHNPSQPFGFLSTETCSQAVSRVLRNIIVIFARTFRVILFSIHNDEWKSFHVINKQHCGRCLAGIVMAFSVISILSDLSEESVGTSTARVILFGTIPTTIPPTTPTIDLPVIHGDTLLTPTIPTIPLVAPTIQYTSPFINTDSSDSDTPDSPPSQDPSPSVPISLPVCGALSPVRADLSPPPKSIRDSDLVTNLEVSLEDGYEPYVPREILMSVLRMLMLLELEGWMIEMWLRRRPRRRLILERDTVEVDPRVGPVIEDGVREPIREDVLDHVTADGAVELPMRHWEGHRITRVDLEVTTMTERISALERDNTRLRGMLDVERYKSMPTATCTKVTQDAINELIAKHLDEALKAYDAGRNPRIESEIKNDQQDDHVKEKVNHGNGNKNGNGNPNVNIGGVVPVARECTYQEFVKCQSLNFKRMEGVVGLTRWFEKMETVFHISNCPPIYFVK